MKDDTGAKYLFATRLIELLQTLPSDTRILVNAVGNLCIESNKGNYVGFIDFLHDGEVVLD